MKIALSKSELEICHYIGMKRYYTTSRACKEQIQSDKSPLEIVIDGVIGEYCVSRCLNLYFSLDTDLRNWGADLFTNKGLQIDVKTTRLVGGNLVATLTSDKKNFDVYILCELMEDGCDVVGWINRDEFQIGRAHV